MLPLQIIKERVLLTLLAAKIPVQACLSNLHQIGSTLKFVPLVDFEWPGFLGVPVQYRVVLFGMNPKVITVDDMSEVEGQWGDYKKICIAEERPPKITNEYVCHWFSIEGFVHAVENIPKSGNPSSLNLELDNAHRTNAEQQVMINRLQLEVERLRLRVSDGE